MKKIGFGAFFIHLDSVLATFGACQSISCVVDIGHTSITVSCVDEGLIVPNSTIKKNFGGGDIDLILYSQLKKRKAIVCDSYNQATEDDFDSNRPMDLEILERIRRKGSILLETPECPGSLKICFAKDKSYPVWNIEWGNSFILSPSMLFHEVCMNNQNKTHEDYQNLDKKNLRQFFNYKSPYFEGYIDEEDYYDETEQYVNKLMIAQSMSTHHINKQEIQDNSKLSENDLIDQWTMSNLEDIISYVILQLKDNEARKKAANQIIQTGGFSQTPFLLEELEDRLIERISVFDQAIERVEVINCVARELNCGYLSWIGASVIPKLECMKDGFISRDKWLSCCFSIYDDKKNSRKEKSPEFGITYLKEKLPFQW